MNLNNLRAAIERANCNNIEFTEQKLEAFAFGAKWYPLHATMNEIRKMLGRKRTWNNDECKGYLEQVFISPVYCVKDFKRRTPSDFTFEECLLLHFQPSDIEQRKAA